MEVVVPATIEPGEARVVASSDAGPVAAPEPLLIVDAQPPGQSTGRPSIAPFGPRPQPAAPEPAPTSTPSVVRSGPSPVEDDGDGEGDV